ncbi:hypothetical protein [Algoriphagus sediminis]|uniref:SPOR domain-containing protein n=1 Tax=Algoriphagus sediminis TaxID=3057113 RepID=A0ABT7YBT1_9BACT|nr:hypothetical protein [Algoriphagus sediminis]MDN3203980.1 hypothetical protein [Algoriphagus sediminis]
MRGYLVVLLFGVVFVGCKSSANVNSTRSDFSNYTEDVSATLPDYPDYQDQLAQIEEPVESSDLAIDDQLAAIGRDLAAQNESEPYFDGYTVLIYSGIDREMAFETQESLEELFPDLNSRMQYEQPRYLLKIGQYKHRFEAQKNYSLLKETFPSVRIIQDRIQRKDFQLDSEKNDNDEGEN